MIDYMLNKKLHHRLLRFPQIIFLLGLVKDLASNKFSDILCFGALVARLALFGVDSTIMYNS